MCKYKYQLVSRPHGKNKKAKKEIKPVAEEIVEEQPIEREVENNDIIEETTEII